jgi:signal peptidase II
MHTATASPSTLPALAHRVAVVTLVLMTIDQVTKAATFMVAEAGRSGAVVPVRNTRLGLGVADASLPMVALLAAIGIVAVGAVGLRRAQAGLLPAWVPGFLIGGAMSNVLDRLAGGAVSDFLVTPWSACSLADLAIVAGVVGWIVTDLSRPSPTRSTSREELHA